MTLDIIFGTWSNFPISRNLKNAVNKITTRICFLIQLFSYFREQRSQFYSFSDTTKYKSKSLRRAKYPSSPNMVVLLWRFANIKVAHFLQSWQFIAPRLSLHPMYNPSNLEIRRMHLTPRPYKGQSDFKQSATQEIC